MTNSRKCHGDWAPVHLGNEAGKVRAFHGERMKISKVWSSNNMANLREFSSILLRLGGELRDTPSWEKTRQYLLGFLPHPGYVFLKCLTVS